MSAQFNFGSLILYDWSEEISSNTKLGFEYMTLAAQQGHIGAMYALAVAHLEGYEIFHSCMLSEKLFKAVLSRGPASRSSQLAYYHYTEGQLSTAAMYYLESAYNGYEVGMINAAVLFDKYSFLEEPGSVLSKFKENPILTKAGTLLEIDETGLLVEAFEDLLGVMSEDDTVSNTTTAIGEHLDLMIAKRLLEVAYTDKSTFATVRLGDYYYYGKAGLARNLSKALSYYTAAQKMNMSIDFQAQAFFSAGYMHQFGEGTPRNLTTARKHYEQASKIGGTVSYIGYIAKFFLEAEHLFRVDYPLLMQGEYFEAAKKFLSSFDPFDTEYTQGLVDSRIAVGLMALLILWTIRKRVSNQMKLVIKEHEAVESQV